MSLANKIEIQISEEEYLEGEIIAEFKHEYIEGTVYAMAGASTKHNQISRNVTTSLHSSLKNINSACETFSSDMKVKVSNITSSFFYPDVMVVCDNEGDDDYYKSSPIIIVEVLSKSTRKNDFTTKMISYFNISSLEEYVLIEQDFCQVQVYSKSKNWQSASYFLGDEITFASIDTILSVEDIYYHVSNDDVVKFLEEKEHKQK
ncbi:MAG: Uma2 family endonuclease [gamma proteobacterium symbiont of Taylorina sp.]|nr:Uma2 family endonuclease [gamma proteobacterium symbiont of Taylorina sp.]